MANQARSIVRSDLTDVANQPIAVSAYHQSINFSLLYLFIYWCKNWQLTLIGFCASGQKNGWWKSSMRMSTWDKKTALAEAKRREAKGSLTNNHFHMLTAKETSRSPDGILSNINIEMEMGKKEVERQKGDFRNLTGSGRETSIGSENGKCFFLFCAGQTKEGECLHSTCCLGQVERSCQILTGRFVRSSLIFGAQWRRMLIDGRRLYP